MGVLPDRSHLRAALVLRWSRARKRYERHGLLVQEEALDRAEQDCLADEDARALRREPEAARRTELDRQHVQVFAQRVRELHRRACLPEVQRAGGALCCRQGIRCGGYLAGCGRPCAPRRDRL